MSNTRLVDIARGCHDYGGGYSDPVSAEIFHHGIQTVVYALEATMENPGDMQVQVLERIGRALKGKGSAPAPSNRAPSGGE